MHAAVEQSGLEEAVPGVGAGSPDHGSSPVHPKRTQITLNTLFETVTV